VSYPTVHILRQPFLNIIASAVEPFKHECIGRFFGRKPTKRHNRFLITNAFPVSCVATRGNKEIRISTRSEKRLVDLFSSASSLWPFLGEFHSHTEWGKIVRDMRLSSHDIEDTISKKMPLNIVVVISSRKRGRSHWVALSDGSVKGSLSKYNFHIGAFILVDEEPVMLKIVSPKALKALNREHSKSA